MAPQKSKTDKSVKTLKDKSRTSPKTTAATPKATTVALAAEAQPQDLEAPVKKTRKSRKRVLVPRIAPEPKPVLIKKKSSAPAAPLPKSAPPAPITPARTHTETPTDDTPQTAIPNYDILAQNMARLIDESGKVFAAFSKKDNSKSSFVSSEISDAVKTLGVVAESWMSDPQKTAAAQTSLSTQFIDLWQHTLKRLIGEDTQPVVAPDPSDKRFTAPEWHENPFFDFLRQAHSVTTNWASHLVEDAEGIDAHTRDKASFYVRQLGAALSPSNFLLTNPELLRTTIEQDGDNLVRGMHMLAEDLEAGNGNLKIRQSDPSKFQVGVNLAVTPGKVIFRNDLIELVQYTPTTETVFKRPLLIVPPWINKFYVLDLNPDKSFIRWAVAQGLTVFVISWVNPDARQALKSFEAYMREGIFAALEAIKAQTGEEQVTAIGYCVGGTLLSATLGYMAATQDKRINSATLLTTQVDFTDPGELKVFVDEEQVRATEEKMAETGYLEGSSMANAFNMLRPNDLIWSYVVKNYLKGEPPSPFDLLYWNSDSTRMPAANHSFYLRHCYLHNDLVNKRMPIGDVMVDLGKVTIPIYNLAAREDHIAPAKSVFQGAKYFGGDMRYVLAGSGHIAGVVNPPYKTKYQYWLGPEVKGDLDTWMKKAVEHPGSWWLDWIKWIEAQNPAMVAARDPATGPLTPLCDAPGTYVKIKA